jgi:hypothetical protein
VGAKAAYDVRRGIGMNIDVILEKQVKYMWDTWNYYKKLISLTRGEGGKGLIATISPGGS